MKIIAVVPAYNEAGRIGPVVRELIGRVSFVVVVDDGSSDATVSEAQSAGAIVLRHLVNCGQGASLATGNAAAMALGADVIVHFDADGQHDPAVIAELVAPIAAGEADVTYGSRFLGLEAVGMPPFRRLMLNLARWFSLIVRGAPRGFTDPQSGLRAMSRRAAELLSFRQGRMAHCSEILILLGRSGLRWREVPTRVKYSADTLSKGQTTFGAIYSILRDLILDALD